MANRRYIDFPIASSVGDSDIILIWQSGANKQTTKATFLSGLPENLDELNDVAISGLTNGQILRYDSVTGKWENTDQGNLDLNDLNDVSIVSPSNGQVLVYNSSTSKWENSSAGFVPYTGAVTTVNLGAQTIQAGSFVKAGGTAAQFLKADGSVDSNTYGTGTVTSVALTMPSAFSVANSPVTTAGTLAVTGAGTVGQYIRGDGSLADFPESSGGGSSVSYYLNGSVAQGTIGGIAYKELNKVPVLGAGTDFTINADGYIASFLTDAGDPNLLEIPGGNWNFETYFSASSGGGSPTFYVELYKVNSGGTATLIASNSGFPELIAFGTNIISYFSTLAVPTTALALTDRLAIRYYVTHSGRTITLHTEDNHLCQIVTTFTTGLTALNGLTAQIQNFAVGTSGTDFAISSATATHTFNLPTASATNRGALSSADWSIFNGKQNALGYTPVPETRTLTINGTTQDLSANRTFNVGDMLLDTIQTVTARKDYNSNTLQLVVNGTSQKTILTNSPIDTGSYSGLINAFGFNASNNLYFSKGANNNGIFAFSNAATRTYTLKDASGTLAFTSDIPSLSGYVQGTGTTNYLPKFTAASTIGNSNIQDSGSLVTINSDTKFQVGANATRNVYFGTAATNYGRITYNDSTGELAIGTIENYNTLFVTNNTTKMTLTSGGNLLVGTTTDNGARLQVSGTARANGISSIGQEQAFTWQRTTGTASDVYSLNADSGSAYLYNNTTANILMLWSEGGNVGIGTASPTNPLHIQSNTLSQLNVTALSGNTNAQINLEPTGTGIALIGPANNVDFAFRTNASERMRITSSGNVGIGFTPSTWDNTIFRPLQIGASGSFLIGRTDAISQTQLGANAFYDGNWKYVISTSANATRYYQNGGEHVFESAGAGTSGNVITWNPRMMITFGGNVLIGTTNDNGFKLRVEGSNYLNGSIYSPFTYNNTSSGSANLGISASGEFYRSTSSLKYKKNVQDYNKGLIEVLQMRPVTYNDKNDNLNATLYAGLIAEEINNLGLVEFVQYAQDGTPDALSYSNMVAILVKSIQELKQEIDTLKN